MKIFFCSRVHNDATNRVLERAESAARALGVATERDCTAITWDDVEEGAVVVSIGGDGTFLEAAHRIKGLPVPIVGINAGRMGFLAQISQDAVPRAIADIAAGRFTIQRRTMIEAEGDFGRPLDFSCAVNEFTLHRHTADLLEVAAQINGEPLMVIRGDGAIVSTPTGSTAYSLSAGGPIVTPECSCFVMSGIAPHNFSVRPLVFSDTAELTLEVHTRGREAQVSLDNESCIVKDGARFRIKKSQYELFLMQIQNISFYDTLRDRTMWGLDRRDNF